MYNWKKAIMAHLRGLCSHFTEGKAHTHKEYLRIAGSQQDPKPIWKDIDSGTFILSSQILCFSWFYTLFCWSWPKAHNNNTEVYLSYVSYFSPPPPICSLLLGSRESEFTQFYIYRALFQKIQRNAGAVLHVVKVYLSKIGVSLHMNGF